MIRLYDYALSENCYKVRLLMRWLELDYETTPIDFYPGREHRSDTLLAVNPLGQPPVIVDGEAVIRDAQAILVHLAANYDKSGQWYPLATPKLLGSVHSWLAFADTLTATCSAARLHDAMFMETDIDSARAGAERLLRERWTNICGFASGRRPTGCAPMLVRPSPTSPAFLMLHCPMRGHIAASLSCRAALAGALPEARLLRTDGRNDAAGDAEADAMH